MRLAFLGAVQADADCDEVDYEQCRVTTDLGACDCLKAHAVPYRLGDDDPPPLLDRLDTPYKAVIGAADTYLSYIVPEPDFNTSVTLLSPRDGDHYEDTVSPSKVFATRLQAAQARIAERW